MKTEENLHTCCILGHRKIDATEETKNKLRERIEKLIKEEKVDTFLFGSRSEFNELCLKLVTKEKEKCPHVKRVYLRAEYPEINGEYAKYLSGRFEETEYPERVKGAGRLVYVKRNYEMIDRSEICLIYYDENSLSGKKNSGTKIAYDYAVKKKKKIYRFPSESTEPEA